MKGEKRTREKSSKGPNAEYKIYSTYRDALRTKRVFEQSRRVWQNKAKKINLKLNFVKIKSKKSVHHVFK